MVDLASNLSYIMENGHDGEHGELAIRNMLTLTDVFSLVSDAAYFCAPAIQQAQEQLSNGTVSGYFQSACSLMSRAGRAARRAVNTVAGAVGAAGVACAAGMSAALTAEFINNDDTDSTGQRVILGMQIAVAAAATTALGCLASKYIRRACGSSSSESQS